MEIPSQDSVLRFPRWWLTSNKPFGPWGDVFGDDVVAAAMIDLLVHHAEVIDLKGDSYRLRNRALGGWAPIATTDHNRQEVAQFPTAGTGSAPDRC